MELYRLIYGHKAMMSQDIVYPVIPQNRLPSEDGNIARICVSKTLDGCLTAIGPSIVGIQALLSYLSSKGETSRPLKRDGTARLIFPFTVFTFNVSANCDYLIDTQNVLKFVADAQKTDECWLIKPCTPSCVSHLWLVDGAIELSFLCCNNRRYLYYQVSDSVWSECCSYATSRFSNEIIKTVERYLENGEIVEKVI